MHLVLQNSDEVNAARVGLDKRKKERARWEWECELRMEFGLLNFLDL